MNQSQWTVLDAMGISSWKCLEPGEVATPKSLHSTQQAAGEAQFLIVVEREDLLNYRQLIQSILTAVNWPMGQVRILTDPRGVKQFDSTALKLIWQIGSEPEQIFKEVSQIDSLSLQELAANPQEKAALWQELKVYRCV